MKYDSKPAPPPMIMICIIASGLLIIVPYFVVLLLHNVYWQNHIILGVCVFWMLSIVGVGAEYLYWKNKEP